MYNGYLNFVSKLEHKNVSTIMMGVKMLQLLPIWTAVFAARKNTSFSTL